MKQYTLSRDDLIHLREYMDVIQCYDGLIKKYIGLVVCPKLSLDLKKGTIDYNLNEGKIYYTENTTVPQEKKTVEESAQSDNTKPAQS